MRYIQILCALSLRPFELYAAPDDRGGAASDDIAPVQRQRQPTGDLAQGDANKRRWRYAQNAAATLRDQEERRAKAAGTVPRPTKTAEDIFAEGQEGEENKQAFPVPTGGKGERRNGIYIPTREEIEAAGYTGEAADKLLERVTNEANNASTRRGLISPASQIPPHSTERTPEPVSGFQVEADAAARRGAGTEPVSGASLQGLAPTTDPDPGPKTDATGRGIVTNRTEGPDTTANTLGLTGEAGAFASAKESAENASPIPEPPKRETHGDEAPTSKEAFAAEQRPEDQKTNG